jgi:hypothetical protein
MSATQAVTGNETRILWDEEYDGEVLDLIDLIVRSEELYGPDPLDLCNSDSHGDDGEHWHNDGKAVTENDQVSLELETFSHPDLHNEEDFRDVDELLLDLDDVELEMDDDKAKVTEEDDQFHHRLDLEEPGEHKFRYRLENDGKEAYTPFTEFEYSPEDEGVHAEQDQSTEHEDHDHSHEDSHREDHDHSHEDEENFREHEPEPEPDVESETQHEAEESSEQIKDTDSHNHEYNDRTLCSLGEIDIQKYAMFHDEMGEGLENYIRGDKIVLTPDEIDFDEVQNILSGDSLLTGGLAFVGAAMAGAAVGYAAGKAKDKMDYSDVTEEIRENYDQFKNVVDEDNVELSYAD